MDRDLRSMRSFIYQRGDWPNFIWKNEELLELLGKVRNGQGVLTGKMQSLGFDLKNEATLETLTLDVIKSSEIEGLILNPDKVRSSIAWHLGLDGYGIPSSDRHIDGIVDITMDATVHCNDPLTTKRLFGWHAALFPTGKSGYHEITVGDWRKDIHDRMRVVSGSFENRKVHFIAPEANKIEKEVSLFLDWFNGKQKLDTLIKAGIAHLWFVTLHPFDDGNGRITRALTDMLLARSDGNSQRYYSMSAQINTEKVKYYDMLESTQRGTLEITNWLNWFLSCTQNALISTEKILEKVLNKHRFWARHAKTTLKERQVKLLTKLIDGKNSTEEFEGKLTSKKWSKIAKCSEDTALRDIQELINKKILRNIPNAGKKSGYELINDFSERNPFDHIEYMEKERQAYFAINTNDMPSLGRMQQEGFKPSELFISDICQSSTFSDQTKITALTILNVENPAIRLNNELKELNSPAKIKETKDKTKERDIERKDNKLGNELGHNK